MKKKITGFSKRKKLFDVAGYSAIVVLIIVTVFFINHSPLTGKAILGINTEYKENETLNGDFTLILKDGELIPADSVITINMNDKKYEYPLSDLISQSSSEGNFYSEGSSVSGIGQGYGIAGTKISYPKVGFTMRIISSVESAEEPAQTSSEEANEQTQTETPAEIPAETNEPAQSETTGEVVSGQTIEQNKEQSQETASTTEEITQTETQTQTSSAETQSEVPSQELSSSSESESEMSGISAITGSVVANLKKEGDIEAKTSKNSPYKYKLKNGESVEIVSSEHEINLNIEGGEAVISTDYSETEIGFGKEFLGNEKREIIIDLSSLKIPAESGVIAMSLAYNGIIIASVADTLSVESPIVKNESERPELNIPESNITTETNLTSNETLVLENETNATIYAENISDYALTDEERAVLKLKTGADSVYITKSEIINGRLVIRFEIGEYWLENSYNADSDKEKLDSEISLDRARWIKLLAEKLSETEEENEIIKEYIGNYSL